MSSGPHEPGSINWDLAGFADDILSEFYNRFSSAVKQGADKIIFHYNGCEWNFETRRKSIRSASSGQIIHERTSWNVFDLTGVEVVIELTAEKSYIDGYFDFDPDDPDDVGGVRVYLGAPQNEVDIEQLVRQARATLTHELYHVGCRLSKSSSYIGGMLSFDEHRGDREEIGARVEEAMALMGIEGNTSDVEAFKKTLSSMIECYLTRNGVALNDPRFESLSSEMFKSHMTEYRWVMGFFG